MRRAAGAVSASLWAVVTLGGCCCTSPSAAIFLPQDDHYTSLRGFLYAIEVGQWDEAYSRLTKESQRDFSATDMWLAFWAKLKIPGTDVPIADLIQKHDPFFRESHDIEGSTVIYRLIYDPEEEPGEQDNFYGMRVFLVRKPIVINGVEMYIWEIDLLRSVTRG